MKPETPLPASADPSARAGNAASLSFLGGLLFVCGFAILKRAFGMVICDDAYITLAHSRSWNEGIGPVMSALNPVCATSTPLHTALLALLGKITGAGSYGVFAYWNNLAWDLVGGFFLYRIAVRGLRLSPPAALAALAAYAYSVNALAVSAYGMETPMYVALALAGTWAALYSPKPLPLLPVVAFLAPLARPEGALLPAALILLRWRKDRASKDAPLRSSRLWGLWSRETLIGSAAAFMGLAAFFAFYQYAYGRWLPHSIIAKRLEIDVGYLEGMRSWIQHVFYKGPSFGGATLTAVGNLLVTGAAIAGYILGRKPGTPGGREEIPWGLLVWPGAYFLFFTFTRSSYILFNWYYLPVLPFLILFIAAGADRLAGGRISRKAAWVMVLAFLAYAPVQTFRQHLPQKHRLAEVAREGRYREAAGILDSAAAADAVTSMAAAAISSEAIDSADPIASADLAPEEPAERPAAIRAPVVMIDEVGAIGYFSRAEILDTHGLLSPEALAYLGGPDGYFLRMAAMQERFDPEWILAMRRVEDEGSLHIGEDALFSGYELFRILRTPPHGFNLEMWRRVRPD